MEPEPDVEEVLHVFDQINREMHKRDMRWGDGGTSGSAMLAAAVEIVKNRKEVTDGNV